jgi:hypothetical protein
MHGDDKCITNLAQKYKMNTPLEGPRHRPTGESNIKMNLEGVVCNIVY